MKDKNCVYKDRFITISQGSPYMDREICVNDFLININNAIKSANKDGAICDGVIKLETFTCHNDCGTYFHGECEKDCVRVVYKYMSPETDAEKNYRLKLEKQRVKEEEKEYKRLKKKFENKGSKNAKQK